MNERSVYSEYQGLEPSCIGFDLETVKKKYGGGKVNQETSTNEDQLQDNTVRRYEYVNKVKGYSKMFAYKGASKVKSQMRRNPFRDNSSEFIDRDALTLKVGEEERPPPTES